LKQESEIEKAKLVKEAKLEAKKLTELQSALQYSMERSQKQDGVVRDMKSVIEDQRITIQVIHTLFEQYKSVLLQELKSQVSLQSQKIKETDPQRLEALEQEVAVLVYPN